VLNRVTKPLPKTIKEINICGKATLIKKHSHSFHPAAYTAELNQLLHSKIAQTDKPLKDMTGYRLVKPLKQLA
jgi:hypothetical protein